MAHEIITITSGSIESGKADLKITIEGDSDMPFWNHDLKVKAILTLLNGIDIKHYTEDNKTEEGYKAYKDIVESAKFAFGMDLFDLD